MDAPPFKRPASQPFQHPGELGQGLDQLLVSLVLYKQDDISPPEDQPGAGVGVPLRVESVVGDEDLVQPIGGGEGLILAPVPLDAALLLHHLPRQPGEVVAVNFHVQLGDLPVLAAVLIPAEPARLPVTPPLGHQQAGAVGGVVHGGQGVGGEGEVRPLDVGQGDGAGQSGFQKGSQLVIEKNKDAGEALKSKYSDLVEKHEQNKQEKLNNREKLTDPLDNHDDTFPSMSDFNSEPAASNKVKEESSPKFEPPIEVSQESTPIATEVEDTSTDDLPASHSYAEEDQKMKQELQTVDHGDLETKQSSQPKNPNYKKPPINLLSPIKNVDQSQDKALIQKNTEVLESTFKSFGVHVIVKKAVLGPTVTRYEVQPAVGVKVSKIVNLADDLALALAAKDIRIEAPIPGKPLIGIEVPNRTTSAVSFKDVMVHQDAKSKEVSLDVPLGKDVEGKVISADLRKMPHLLIAGSTGSGKSVAINTIITSVLMKAYPEDVKLVLIDPKMVELSVYNGIPHLLIPVVTDAKLATNALRKTVKEMERRYQLFAAGGVRNITEYNQKVVENNADKNNSVMEKLPYIVVIVDELSDLMMVAGHDVEDAIVRLAQMARAAGIHMILATQRPSVDVITGLIKANVPSRISFAVSSGVDSRTILDQVGAEKLLGRGDMLFLPIGAAKPERVQGAYISVTEVEKIVSWVKEQQEAVYNEDMIPSKNDSEGQAENEDEPEDEFYDQAVALVRKQQSASVSMLQRRFRIGYNRAARIVDEMEAKGIVGPSEGSKPRQVLIPPEKDDDQ